MSGDDKVENSETVLQYDVTFISLTEIMLNKYSLFKFGYSIFIMFSRQRYFACESQVKQCKDLQNLILLSEVCLKVKYSF